MNDLQKALEKPIYYYSIYDRKQKCIGITLNLEEANKAYLKASFEFSELNIQLKNILLKNETFSEGFADKLLDFVKIFYGLPENMDLEKIIQFVSLDEFRKELFLASLK